MPLYLTQASYTSDSWKAQIANPQNRAAQIKKIAESAGCKLHEFYYTFGEFDAVVIIEAPDNVTVSAVLIAAAGGGAVSKLQTTVLLTAEEGLQAIKKAKGVGYTPPGR
ncbi:MAG: GYD domain-containing protein [Chloroflexi bacterium]|nr:GYD domain-containing protein [Chloroflexota bacterium]